MGQEFEAYINLITHERGIPLLASSLILRELGAGQIDAAVVIGDCLHIVEAKTSGWPNGKQLRRLYKSGNWIALYFNYECKLWLAKKLLPNGHRFFNLNL